MEAEEEEWEERGEGGRVMGSGGGGDSRLKVTSRRRKFHGGQRGAMRDGQRWERMRRRLLLHTLNECFLCLFFILLLVLRSCSLQLGFGSGPFTALYLST